MLVITRFFIRKPFFPSFPVWLLKFWEKTTFNNLQAHIVESTIAQGVESTIAQSVESTVAQSVESVARSVDSIVEVVVVVRSESKNQT